MKRNNFQNIGKQAAPQSAPHSPFDPPLDRRQPCASAGTGGPREKRASRGQTPPLSPRAVSAMLYRSLWPLRQGLLLGALRPPDRGGRHLGRRRVALLVRDPDAAVGRWAGAQCDRAALLGVSPDRVAVCGSDFPDQALFQEALAEIADGAALAAGGDGKATTERAAVMLRPVELCDAQSRRGRPGLSRHPSAGLSMRTPHLPIRAWPALGPRRLP